MEKEKPIYRLAGLSKEYGGRMVLQVDHLEIHRGDIFALVGPSGAGKSTLLRLLNFLESPTRGRLEFDSIPLPPDGAMPLHVRRRVTMVFQRPTLLDRTVWDNVAYGLRLRSMRNGKDQVESALAEVGLAHVMKQSARTLSGGEAQRVALARAMVLRPDVLLLDEPTANLDPYNVSLIESIVRRLNAERQTTLVLVTHNTFQAKRLATRTAFLLDGCLIEVSDTPRFFNAPLDPRTRAFVQGEMVC